MSAKRDWGYAPEYIEAMWLMLQHPEPDDFVIVTGTAFSIRQFVEFCFAEIDIQIDWGGHGVNEVGKNRRTGKTVVTVDPRYFRPLEVESLRADPSKAERKLGWKVRQRYGLRPSQHHLLLHSRQTSRVIQNKKSTTYTDYRSSSVARAARFLQYGSHSSSFSK